MISDNTKKGNKAGKILLRQILIEKLTVSIMELVPFRI
jgi:hypothetical protein